MGNSFLGSMSKRTIIVGDVHGCYRELVDLLEKVSFNSNEDEVVFVGDLVGKGPETSKVVQYAMDLNAKCVMGNHEDVLVRYYKHSILKDESVTPPSLRGNYPEIVKSLTDEQWKYILNLPLYLRLEEHNAIIVHAGLVPNIPIDEQDPFYMMNLRNILPDGTASKEQGDTPWINSWNGPEILFFGHDAVRGLQIKKDPETDKVLAVGLDTGACYGKKLTAYILPEGKVVSQDSHEVYEEPTIQLK